MEIRTLLEAHGLRPQPALLGFSGGADSTALLMLLLEAGWQDVLAVHFNHHLRGEAADADAQWCAEFCRKRGIRFKCINLFVRDDMRRGESLESAARRCRMDAWRKLLEDGTRRVLFLGHHADDRLEELFLRLGRGANATGLTSLRIRRDLDGGKVILCRPLLEFRKPQLEEALRQRGVADWRVDATNLESCCRRNAIRNRLLPMIREIFGTDAGFRQALRVLTEDAMSLESAAKAALDNADDSDSTAFWRTLDKPRLLRALRLKWPAIALSADSVERLFAALQHGPQEGTHLPLGAGQRLHFRQGRMELETTATSAVSGSSPVLWRWREQPVLLWYAPSGEPWRLEARSLPPGTPVQTIQAPENGWRECFAAEAIPEVLTVRTWHAGDRIAPFGGHGHHRKLQDIFSDAHIRGDLRLNYPLVGVDSELLWIPSLVRAETGRVMPGTSIVCLMAAKCEKCI